MKIALALLALAVAGAVAAVGFIWSGLYDVSAADQHLRVTYHALRVALHRSVERRADSIEVPPLDSPALLRRGLVLYREHCVQCHGAPGVAPEPFSLGLRPLATPLVRTGRDRDPAYIFWIVKYGIKMTGMPAWDFRMPDEDMWAVTAFVRHMPTLSPEQYARLPEPPPSPREEAATGEPDPKRGKRALEQYGCVACHEVPGLVGPEARVGPTLHGVGARGIIAGVLPNTPANMARFLRDPRSISPHSAMPDLGVTERDARDMAAHLATLR